MAASLLSRSWVFTLLLMLGFVFAKAQSITRYVTSSSSGTLSKISGTEPGGVAATRDDNNTTYANIPIGFDFWYMGQLYTSVSASSNGWFTFGSTIGDSAPINNLSSGGTTPVIAPLWDDLSIYEGVSLIDIFGGIIWTDAYGTFTYQSSGSVGSRVLTLEWFRTQWSVSAAGATMSFQAKIYENGNIEFMYGSGAYGGLLGGNYGTGAVNAGSASVGITATDGNFLSLSNLGTTPTVNVNTEVSNISVKPANGQTYIFDPTEIANAPTNLTFSAIGSSGYTLNWTDNSGNDEIGFVIYQSTSLNGNYTHLATTAANVTSYQVLGLPANSTRYYRVYALRENLSVGYASGNRATLANCNTVSVLPLQIAFTNTFNYRLNGTANDFYNINNGTLLGAPVATQDRFGIAGNAYNFNGTSQYVSTANSFNNPNNFTVSIWFKTSTNSGGSLLGFNINQTGAAGNHDRHLYIGADGKIYFGVFGGAVRMVSSSTAYNDNQWHMATATISSTAGITLYVDGVAVATNSAGTTGENYTGYWRMASQAFNVAWTSAPTSSFYAGALDDAFVFNRVLTATEISTLYNAPYGVQNNGPVCVGTTLQLVGPTIAGATYAWSGPNGFASTLQNPTLTYALAAAGPYSLIVNMGGCTDVARTIVVSSAVAGQWTGLANVNWSDASNWCDGVLPTSAVDVTIPTTGPTYSPTLTTTGNANNINVQSGRTLTINNGGNLQVAGAITNAGSIVTTSGKVTFNGTTAQVIPTNVFSTNTIMDLELNNAAGVTLGGALRLTGILTASAGAFNANGHLTLASNEAATAAVAPISGGASITGQVKVERYLQGGARDLYRGYRMLSSPVYDNTTSFVSTNIEGNRTAKFTQFIDDMIITGTGGATNGFDESQSNPVGAWSHNLGYVGIPNINTSVNAGRGMYLFFRGNRNNISLKTNSPYPDPEHVVMDFDGVLNQQDVTVNLNYSATLGGFNLLGNPYAATIDWDSSNWGADKVGISNSIWIWNPVKRSYATYVNGLGNLDGSRYIASGQSFFVQASALGSVKFKEGIKVVSQQPPVLLMSAPSRQTGLALGVTHSQTLQARSVFRMTMKPLASFGEDETVIAFSEGSDANYTTEDALHLNGEIVNIASLIGTRRLAINFLPPSTSSTKIGLMVTSEATGNYMFKFNLAEYFQGHSLMLKDNLLQEITPILHGGVYNFNIDKANADTFGNNRFSIIVEPPAVLPIASLNFTAQKQNNGILLFWSTADDLRFKQFNLYRAGNDGVYNLLANVPFKSTREQTFMDFSPLVGHNYYKLVGLSVKDGEVETESLVVDFNIGNLNNVAVYPNPIIDNFTVQVDRLSEEKYQLVLFDLVGRKLGDYFVTQRELNEGYLVDVSKLNLGIFVMKIEEVVTGKVISVEKLIKN